jgi:hypothetical protein
MRTAGLKTKADRRGTWHGRAASYKAHQGVVQRKRRGRSIEAAPRAWRADPRPGQGVEADDALNSGRGT